MITAFSQARRAVLAALLLGAALLAAGCFGGSPATETKSQPAPAPAPEWTYAPKALELTFVSDPFLNEYDGAAHTLSVCVYQLTDPEAFRKAAATVTGLAQLLECASFDKSVVSARRATVQPGRNEVLTFDRDGKARFVAVVCGYYGRSQVTATRIYDIPVDTGSTGWLFWKETTYSPGKLARKIILGRTGLVGDGL